MASLPQYREKPPLRGLSHRASLLVPSLCALLGSTYPRAMLGFGVWAGGLLAIAAICEIRRRRTGWTKPSSAPSRAGAAVVLSVVFLLAGAMRGFYWEALAGHVDGLTLLEGPTEVTLVPLDYPLLDDQGSRGSFRALAWSDEAARAGWFGVQATVFPKDGARLSPGTPVRCVATFRVPPPAMNPGGFDYRGYLLGERVFALADVRGVMPPEKGGLAGVRYPSLALRAVISAKSGAKAYMGRAMAAVFPSGDAAVLRGVFLGDRGGLSPEDSRDFRRSGFYRFVAVCGFHVDLLLSMVEAGFRRLTKRPSLSRVVAILVASCYADLSGCTPGALRALVSASMRSLAPPLRRKYHPLAGLGASALAAAWRFPRPLANTGFMLSFAGAGGAWLGGLFGEIAARMSASRSLKSRLREPSVRVLTMSLVLLPIVALAFNEVSVVSFFLSGAWGMIAAAVVPLAAAVAFVPGAGIIFGWLPYVLLNGVRAVARFSSSLPLAGLRVPSPGPIEIAAYWVLLLIPLTFNTALGASRAGEDARLFFRRRRLLANLRRVALVGAPALLFTTAALRLVAPWPEVTFLYVGQGDCAVIRKGASVMMVDTGTASAFGSHVLPYLRAKGITRVDLCVISHLHADHAGGLPALCSELSVGHVAVPLGFSDPALKAVAEGGLFPGWPLPQVTELAPGCEYAWGEASLRVTMPRGDPNPQADSGPGNDSGLAFVLDFGGIAVELWGDSPADSISSSFEENPWLLSGSGPRILKVPHHGSADSYEPRLYTRPGSDFLLRSVISVGPNSYGHPSIKVEEAAQKAGGLTRTDRSGATTFSLVFGKLLETAFLPGPSRKTGSTGRSVVVSH